MGHRSVEKQDSWFSKLGAIVLSILSWIGSVFSLPRAEISYTDREVTELPRNATYSDSSRSPSPEPPSTKSEVQPDSRGSTTYVNSKFSKKVLIQEALQIQENARKKLTRKEGLSYIEHIINAMEKIGENASYLRLAYMPLHRIPEDEWASKTQA